MGTYSTLGSIPGTVPDVNQLIGGSQAGRQMPPLQSAQDATDQQAGLFQQLQNFHQSLISGRQLLMQIAQSFPQTAEDVRNALQGVDAVSKSMSGLVVSMTSQVPETPMAGTPMVG